jgi:tetratricopeptide (TPR) repeat protein
MFHKSQTAISNYSKTLNYQRISMKISARKPRISSKSPKSTKKKINTRIHSSFTICDEIYSPHNRLRSTSVDKKYKNASFDYTGLRKGNRPLQSFQNFDEKLFEYINLGRQEIQKGNISQAMNYFDQALDIEGKNPDALYNKGLACMLMNLYKEATINFLNVLKENSTYNKDVYLKLSMCFNCMKDASTALRYISQGIHRYPKFYQGYLYRGQIYNELKQWDKAMSDFKKVLSGSKTEGNALIGIAESLEGVGDTGTAIQMLEQARSCPETSLISLLKMGILKAKIKDESAVRDLEVYLENDPKSSQAFFYKAELLFEKHQYTEAALCYEQCIKYDVNYEYTPRAIFHLGAIKIHEKDFYGALHTFERVGKHELKDQKVLQSYAEAVINLMKRKYKDGITAFNKLLKKQDPIMTENIGNCYMYRGYGYNALNMHEKAIRSFKKAANYGKLNKASCYNQELSYALMAANKNNYSLCLTHLEKCLKVFPKKAEPYIYNAAMVLQQSYETKDEKKMEKAEKLLTKSMKIREIDSEMLFFRSTVRYLLNKTSLAAEDIKLCIEKAEDNIAEHYILRGLCSASERSYSDAIQDFTIGLQLKESLEYVYWYRSRAAYLIDDTSLAFSDLQKYMLVKPNDAEVYYQASVLLIMGGSYDDALKALTNSSSLKPSTKAVYLKSKCYVIMNDIASAIDQLKTIKENKTSVDLDLSILKYLQTADYNLWKVQDFANASNQCSKWTEINAGEIFELKHILWLKGVYLMYADNFLGALDEFQQVLEILHTKDPATISADEALTTEEENCEILYNIALCHTKSKKSQSLNILADLSEILNSKHKGQMLLLSSIIQLSLNNTSLAEKLLKEAFQCDSETVTPFLAKETTTILPLNTTNPFAQQFPLLSLGLSTDTLVRIRPAISLPRSSLPNIEFDIEKEVENFFTINKVTPRPEAPWLNRIRGSIQFTSNLVDIDESSQISEREVQENNVKDTSQDIQIHFKSAVPLRHFSSYIAKENKLLVDKKIKQDPAPDDILDKIRNFCSVRKNESNLE